MRHAHGHRVAGEPARLRGVRSLRRQRPVTPIKRVGSVMGAATSSQRPAQAHVFSAAVTAAVAVTAPVIAPSIHLRTKEVFFTAIVLAVKAY